MIDIEGKKHPRNLTCLPLRRFRGFTVLMITFAAIPTVISDRSSKHLLL